jgi:tripartite-type tricarboxylate transporter receptor subunit TctC
MPTKRCDLDLHKQWRDPFARSPQRFTRPPTRRNPVRPTSAVHATPDKTAELAASLRRDRTAAATRPPVALGFGRCRGAGCWIGSSTGRGRSASSITSSGNSSAGCAQMAFRSRGLSCSCVYCILSGSEHAYCGGPARMPRSCRISSTESRKRTRTAIVPSRHCTADGSRSGSGWRPDGYTISQIPLSVFRAPFLTKTTYDPSKDFTFIIGFTGYAYGVVVRNDARWKSFPELFADAKASPGKITFGTPGANTTQHVTMSVIAKRQGINWVHIPFRGTPEMTSALLGGHVDVSADTTAWGPQVNSGELRLLVTFGAKRLKKWPTVPTSQDLGIDFVANSPYGLAGPKGMDRGITELLHDAFKKGMEEPTFKTTLDLLDQEFLYMSSADYTNFAMAQIAEQRLLVDELGLKQE